MAIDRFGDVAVIHADSPGRLSRWAPVAERELDWCRTAYGKVHARQTLEGSAAEQPLWGDARASLVVRERAVGSQDAGDAVAYEVRPASGLSVGLFLDMRDVRDWLRDQADGRRVLNLFAYTCSFGVCAALGGASRVLNIDVSRPYLDWGRRNYALNGLDAEPKDFVYGDALDWLGRFARRGEAWDVVVVDPPSFSSTPFSITRDYARLVALVARVVSPAGMLIAAANHAGTSDERFDSWIRAGLEAADRRGHEVARWHEPAIDFPVGPGQRPYLKVRALVLD